MIWHESCDDIEIEEKTKPLPAKKQLKNYELKYLSIEDNELLDGFRTTFIEPPEYSQDLEQLHLHINHKIDNRNVMTKQACKKTMYQKMLHWKTYSQSWKRKLLNDFEFDFLRAKNNLVTTHSWNT